MKDNTKKTLKIYLQHCLKYKAGFFAIALAIICASALTTVFPLFFKKFFDILATNNSDIAQTASSLTRLIVIILLLDLLSWGFWRVASFTMTYFQPHVIADLSNTCFAYLHKHSYSFFENNFVGSLTKRVKWFSQGFEAIHDRFVWDILPLVVNIIFIIIVLSSRSFWLGLAVSIWLIIFLAGNWLFAKFKIRYDIQRAQKETETTGLLADTITNAHTV